MNSCHRLAAAVALLLAAGTVLAHPSVVGSTPKNGEVLVVAPRQMRIVFSEPIESGFSSVKLVDVDGKDVGGEQTRPDPDDAKAIVVELPTLAAGAYRAHWSALGRDGHRLKGELTFSVK
jgi:methionine-rich copper-binding protein CopC